MLASPPLIPGKSRMRKRACTDLCGGRSAMVVPTATTISLFDRLPDWKSKLSIRMVVGFAEKKDFERRVPGEGGPGHRTRTRRDDSRIGGAGVTACAVGERVLVGRSRRAGSATTA